MVFTTELLDFRRETILYLVLGPLALLLNIPIVVLILSSRTLRIRKEFIMIIGLCLVDATCGLAYTSTGIYRLRLIDSHRLEEITSRFFCNKTFGQVVLIQFDQLMSCIVVVTTLDRAFAIFKPIAYFKLSPFYAWKVVLFVFLQAAFFYVLSHILTMDNEAAEVSALCYTSDSVDATFYDVLRGIRIVSVTISIVMYIPIGIRLIYFAKHQSEVNFSSSRFKQLKTMTITVGKTNSYVDGYSLHPHSGRRFAANLFGLARHAMFFYLLNLSKCSLNVFIFSWRHKEILEEIRLRLGQLKSRKVKRINRISSENFKIRSSEAITKF
ncbi:hypothetical protein L596_024123 [Steinernema carpocapsae]|uniref:G-protein coupled receptors family 1 profile domain-containing protein n=1 Tax=Steinernema carpocapsae TaxID=34508 RepID=A0A4U5MFT9_STECR|nr:hypothetical protein L596_024123 [Steinernema carpocapsae]